MESKLLYSLLFLTFLKTSYTDADAESSIFDFYTEDVVCRGENYIPDVTDCRRYFDCSTGTPIPLMCPLGLYWNSLIDYCDFPSAVPQCLGGTRPPLPTGGTFPTRGSTETVGTTELFTGSTTTDDPDIDCETVANGYLPHHDCTKFYICSNYVGTVYRCPLGLYWNHDIFVCDYPTSVDECVGGTRAPLLSSKSVTEPYYL